MKIGSELASQNQRPPRRAREQEGAVIHNLTAEAVLSARRGSGLRPIRVEGMAGLVPYLIIRSN